MTIDTQAAPALAALRADFPILERTMHGRPLVYLDSANTSQKPTAVLEAMDRYYRRHNANVHRSVYELAEEATAAYEGARARVADFIGATPEETVFVRNASEAINLVAYTWGRKNLRAGDALVLTELEHHSNLVPWHILAHEAGVELRYVEVTADGSLDLDSLDRHLAAGNVKLVGCAYISNMLGTIAPIEEIARRAHAHDALLLVDAAQAVPHMAVDVRALDVDFLAFTGHKMLGPMGIGVLYGKRAILQEMPPFLGGGEMIRRVTLEGSTWNDLPWKYEAGTPNVGGAVGLGAAVDYLAAAGIDAIRDHDLRLTQYALQSLRELPDVTVYGPEVRGAVLSFNLEGVHPHDLASILDEQGIAIRAGHHCTQPLHRKLGIAASARASIYLYNQESELDALIAGIEKARQVLA